MVPVSAVLVCELFLLALLLDGNSPGCGLSLRGIVPSGSVLDGDSPTLPVASVQIGLSFMYWTAPVTLVL